MCLFQIQWCDVYMNTNPLYTKFLKQFIMIDDATGVTGHYPITWATQITI